MDIFVSLFFSVFAIITLRGIAIRDIGMKLNTLVLIRCSLFALVEIKMNSNIILILRQIKELKDKVAICILKCNSYMQNKTGKSFFCNFVECT